MDISYDYGGRSHVRESHDRRQRRPVNTTFGYDAANRGDDDRRLWRISRWGAAAVGRRRLATYVYSYDDASRVTSETDAEGTASFTYDHANELTGVTGSRTESYSYDLNGNRNATGYSTGTENEQTAHPGIRIRMTTPAT